MKNKNQEENLNLFVRNVLLSTGEFTVEGVIKYDNMEFYDTAPMGLTLGLKETQSETNYFNNEICKNLLYLSQEKFDKKITEISSSQVGTAFSLAYLKFLAYKGGFIEGKLFKYIISNYKTTRSSTRIICNILNGGKHAHNELSFCEFMIIPQGESVQADVKIASEIYLDLESIVMSVPLGREGGFAPGISKTYQALDLIMEAINKRNVGKCKLAIDVAANNFASLQQKNIFTYTIDQQEYSTKELIAYYLDLLPEYPLITYLEDPFHENDVVGRNELFNKIGKGRLIVADDLTVSKVGNIQKYQEMFNACILKINQARSVSELINSYNYCKKHGIATIISQRSGETDSNILAHLAVGLGCDYFKAGAPARERIVKYNELLRIC